MMHACFRNALLNICFTVQIVEHSIHRSRQTDDFLRKESIREPFTRGVSVMIP